MSDLCEAVETTIQALSIQLEEVIKDFRNCKSELQSAQPRKKGKWIVDISDYKSVCSVCGADETEFIYGTEMWYGLGKSKFCPNCGAEMKGEE